MKTRDLLRVFGSPSMRALELLTKRVVWVGAIAQGVLWLSVVEVGIRTLPLPTVARLLGVHLETQNIGSGCASEPLRLHRHEMLRIRSVGLLARRWPFCDGPCLREALVYGHIIRRLRPHLRVGVASSGGLVAHAWLEVAGNEIGNNGKFLPLIALSDDRDRLVASS